jgi:signal transduction histidine kinase
LGWGIVSTLFRGSLLSPKTMKLTHKLTLAFLLVSLIAIGLAAAFVGITTSIGFNKYLVDQRQEQFVAIATDFYRTNDNWSGVDTVLREQGLLPPFAQPGSKPPDPQPFALVDQNRVVIIAGGEYQPGERIQKGVLAKGIGIEIDGLAVGTVLTTGQTPMRSTIEQKYINSVNRSLLVAALGSAAIALLLGLFLARTLTHPLRDLTEATRQMAGGKLEQQVPVRSKDELGELAQSFNQMSADLAHANQARRQMTADIAHDLRNPLTVIGGYLESLQDGKLKPTPERFATMQAEVQHLQHLVEDLRMLSLADAGELQLQIQHVAPEELLGRIKAAYHHQAEERGIWLEAKIQPGLGEIALDLERMEQVLGNLVSNALRYTPEGGKIILSARRNQDNLILEIQDNGSGISPEVLPHIFERSYRGDPSRSGNESGLGLAIVKSIVKLHGGQIDVESQLGAGSRFVINIPDIKTSKR